MEIRGTRECKRCGTRWSYYDTGSVSCPDCGSIRSVGVDDERALHTDAPAEFDLTPVRTQVDEIPQDELAEALGDAAREYIRQRGFIAAGELQPLDDTYLAAAEAANVADAVGRSLSSTDDEQWYFFELLRTADNGDRVPPTDVPDSLRDARGLAYASAAGDYRREVGRWLDVIDDPPGESFARGPLESLGDHIKRIEALQGDVPPETAETLVSATHGLSAYLRADDPDGLADCRERLDRLSSLAE